MRDGVTNDVNNDTFWNRRRMQRKRTRANAEIPALHSVSSEVPSAAAITRVRPKNNRAVL